jgi:hypothetical protein
MKSSKRSFVVVAALFAVLSSSPSLVVSAVALNARDAYLAPLILATAKTAKQQCINVCHARYIAPAFP